MYSDVKSLRVCAQPVFAQLLSGIHPVTSDSLQLLSEILKASPASWRQWGGMKR